MWTTITFAATDGVVKKMSEYGKGYILKGALLDAVDWDNDIEKWTIRDDDLESLMTEDNDVVEVTRCKDCVKSEKCMLYSDYRYTFFENDFCSYGWDGEE